MINSIFQVVLSLDFNEIHLFERHKVYLPGIALKMDSTRSDDIEM